ncbi:hypothetical protein B1R32_13126 [Abditibacterium utsteinense]|uniref:Uncharacterized protein n=1 Tax=Abditibacterium utsteinense TaxID=1960156 RepID=A0A2S8SNZ2_9BACT|nr:hypothetical protein [Abditibacterium utsteinense]PQV62513.1 hypothetical protein B1R32_13126 [Abditibacterium utsteinense]
MKSPIEDPLFCGVISLQLAAASFVLGQSWGDSLPISVVANDWNGARIEVGASWPLFAAYDENGVRRPVMDASRSTGAVIIKSSCSCDEVQVSNWLEAARQKGESVTLIMPISEEEEKKVITRNRWQGRVLRVRRGELERLGLLKTGMVSQLPLMAHLDSKGNILGMQGL